MAARANILREVRRCQKGVAAGGPVGFWIRRLTKWAEMLEADAAILRAEISRLSATTETV